MLHKTADLTGPLLDAAVAMAEGHDWEWVPWGPDESPVVAYHPKDVPTRSMPCPFNPTQDGGVVMAIMGRERIEVSPPSEDVFEDYPDAPWLARAKPVYGGTECTGCVAEADGPTAPIAVLRAHVAAKLGSEVDIPEPDRQDSTG